MKVTKSNCVYCGLPNYGKGCRFGPRQIHVHPTPNRCMYCGLTVMGKGCRFAPSGIHVRFGDFGFIQREQYNQGLLTGYLFNKLSEPIESHDAYKLGIVNEHGELLRQPETEQEQNACNMLEMMLISLKRQFGDDIHYVINETIFKSTLQDKEFDVKSYQDEVDFKGIVEDLAKQLYNAIDEYKDRLNSEKIDQCIMEGFKKHYDVTDF